MTATIRLTQAERAALRKIAYEEDRSMGSVMRLAVQRELRRYAEAT